MLRHPAIHAAIATALLALAAGPAAADSDNERELRARLLAAGCTGCHGTDGHSPDAIPAIAGKKAGYIARHLRQYKTDQRQATVMNRLAKGYSDEEIELLAEWFANR